MICLYFACCLLGIEQRFSGCRERLFFIPMNSFTYKGDFGGGSVFAILSCWARLLRHFSTSQVQLRPESEIRQLYSDLWTQKKKKLHDFQIIKSWIFLTFLMQREGLSGDATGRAGGQLDKSFWEVCMSLSIPKTS